MWINLLGDFPFLVVLGVAADGRRSCLIEWWSISAVFHWVSCYFINLTVAKRSVEAKWNFASMYLDKLRPLINPISNFYPQQRITSACVWKSHVSSQYSVWSCGDYNIEIHQNVSSSYQVSTQDISKLAAVSKKKDNNTLKQSEASEKPSAYISIPTCIISNLI